MIEQDVALDPEDFDMAATRPPMLLGLPHTLTVALITVVIFFIMLYQTGDLLRDTIADVIFTAGVGMVWSTAKFLLRSDYHGWGNFCAWLFLDARFLDTAERGGAGLSTMPLRSIYRSGAADDAH